MSYSGFEKQQPPYQPEQPYSPQGYQYPGYPTVQQNYSVEFMQGQKYKEKALIFGILGFFFLGIVFGPLAISNASKAESMHHSATAGKVLGWVATITSIIWIVFLVIVVAVASQSGY